ncbi:GntR family transcriptional regulator [Mucilaginibacter sp.]|uniref:GntR family transcriptional regulator n=1 Tax=Mucilaginibacter sp. TaxID=1882438 RepID=UPI0025F65810|nr:GntR family transcriptional regulator [Mucilaginibacter sp.]
MITYFKSPPFFDHIKLDEYSGTPIYLQLANSIVKAIRSGDINKDELLPSINDVSFRLEVARDTAEKAYRHLKKIGVVGSYPGKGYYVANPNFSHNLKIFLLFNKLSAHKKIIYDAFIAALGETALVDFYVYNNDYGLFKKLFMEKSYASYSHYVIVPHFLEGEENACEIINTIPKEKLVLLDKKIPGITGNYAAVYENFEKDIYEALKKAHVELSRYHTLKIIFPQNSYFPKEILTGFIRFCREHAFLFDVVKDIDTEAINYGEVFINLMEDDLVKLIERALVLKLEIGKDIGVISYNETPIKKIILNGISTISTDFKYMGEKAAHLITNHSSQHVEVPFNYIKRYSA